MSYSLLRKRGKTWKRVNRHRLKTKSDAVHHKKDIKGYNPHAKLRIKRLKRR